MLSERLAPLGRVDLGEAHMHLLAAPEDREGVAVGYGHNTTCESRVGRRGCTDHAQQDAKASEMRSQHSEEMQNHTRLCVLK